MEWNALLAAAVKPQLNATKSSETEILSNEETEFCQILLHGMEMKGKGFLPKKDECNFSSRKSSGTSRCSSSVDDSRVSYQMNGHMSTAYVHKDCPEIHLKRSSSSSSVRRAYDVHSYPINMESEDICEKKSRKDRDKDSQCSPSSAKPPLEPFRSVPSCSDQDLEFYPIDEYNPTPSTFTAWDAFMAGNQAYFREPCCVTDYACTGDSFAYMDVIPEEDASVLESDTDDTGSSVSTVIDKFSRASTANSSFSERIKTKEEPPLVTFDLEQVLSPFEQLEKELDEGTGSELISKVMNGDYDLSESQSDSPKTIEADYSSVESVKHPGNQSIDSIQSYFAARYEKDEISIETFRHSENKSPNKSNEDPVSGPETSDEVVVPPIPARVRSLSVPKDSPSDLTRSTKYKNEEKVSQPTPPPVVPRKREPYPTPTVPPRMSKHPPARRTRSDPGSSDAPTPSRIPRPTFVTRSSTFTEKVTPCNQTPKSTKTTKSSSQKIISPKKLRFTDKEKTSETSESSVQRTSARLNNTSTAAFDSVEGGIVPMSHLSEKGKDSAELVQQSIAPLSKATNVEEGSVSTIGKIANIPGGLFTHTTEEDYTEKETQRLPSISSNQSNTADVHVKSTKKVGNEQKNNQESFDDPRPKTSASSELSRSMNKANRVVGDKDGDSALTVNIPKIEIIGEDESRTATEENVDLMGKIERIVEHHVQGMISTSSDASSDSAPPGDAKDNQQRPIEDILKALDNLCSMPSPKDVEISIDWAPIGEGMVNITEKILSPGITSLTASKKSHSEEELKSASSTQKEIDSEICDRSDMLTEIGSPPNTNLKGPEPQQATLEVWESLPVSDRPSEEEEEHKTLGPGTPVVSSAGPNDLNQQTTEEAPEASHALPAKGHCHRDTASMDTYDGKYAMDMLSKPQKDVLFPEETFSTPLQNGRQPPDGHDSPGEYQDTFQSLNNQCLKEDVSSARHSSGCDDSGVFLEDLPYTTETTNNNHADSKTKSVASTIQHPSEKISEENVFEPGKAALSDMRQYSIEAPNGAESDEDKSDDLGLASSSVDSADDLDADPLPLTITIPESETITFPKSKPPPVPVRKSIINSNACRNPAVYQQTESVKQDVAPPSRHSLNESGNAFRSDRNSVSKTFEESLNSERKNGFQPQYQKWKSEECLRSHIESKWSFSGRQKEKAVSVKDRIAMFSEMETNSNTTGKKEEQPLPRFGSENNVKLARSTENLEKKVEIPNRTNDLPNSSLSSSTLTRENKWHSMCNLPPPTSSSLSNEKISDSGKSYYNMSSLVPSSQESVTSDPHFSDAKKDENDCHKFSEKPIVSSYPQTQLTNNKRYNYSVYNLKTLKSPEDSRKSTGLLSIIDPRKQAPLPKLKGLVIPDRPSLSSTSKALPTIVSSDSVLLPIKSESAFLTDFSQSKDWKKPPFTASSSKSLPRSRGDRRNKNEASNDGIKCNALGDPPWKLNNSGSTLPKYSPAFKRRMLELPHGLGSSLSPTPPSSITSPLSPPPSSPSSICSSNASSSSVAAKQQNIFQFSLSHSKPVTPVLPEKPIMSPPSMPSDVEYEGDNSEDSSTSASPMLQAMDLPKHENCSSTNGFLSAATNSNTAISRKESNGSNNYQSVWKQCPSTETTSSAFSVCANGSPQLHTTVNRSESITMRTKPDFVTRESYLQSEGFNAKSLQPASNKSTTVSDEARAKNNLPINKDSPASESCNIQRNCAVDNDNYFTENDVVAMQNATNIFHSSPEGADEIEGSRNGFTETRQEVFVGKFRAQPMKLNDAVNESFHSAKLYSDHELGVKYPEEHNSYPGSYGSLKNGCSVNNYSTHDDGTPPLPEKHHENENQWSQADLISFKKRTHAESEDDDSQSSLSQRTEDSRHTTDDYLSDTTTDSLEKSIDPEFRPRKLSQQRTVLRAATEGTDSVQKFRALAEKWEQRAEPTDSKPPVPPPPVTIPAVKRDAKLFSSVNSPSTVTNGSVLNSPLKLPPSLMPRQHSLEISTERKNTSVPFSPSLGTKSTREPIPRVTRSTSLNEDRFTSESTWTSEQIPLTEKVKATSETTSTDRTWNNEPSSPVKSSAKEDKLGLISDRTTRKIDSSSVVKSSTLPGFKNNTDSIWKDTASNIPPKSSFREERWNNGTHSYIKTNEERELLINGRPDRTLLCGRLSSVRDTIKDFSSSRTLSKSQMLNTSGKDALGYASSYLSRTKPKSVSVSDIRKAFETQVSLVTEDKPKLPPRRIASEDGVLSSKHASSPAVNGDLPPPDHRRVSSFDSTVSEPDMTVSSSGRYGSVGSLPSVTKDIYGSVTSLSSTTSLISPQDLQQLIEEANLSLEEAGSLSHEILVVVLHRETPGGSIGITLAGGADYEVKEITVHKVISGSLADRDGRIRKGDRVISINGRNLKGITHRDALEILKAPRPEVVLVISREKEDCDQTKGSYSQDQGVREGIKNAENFRRKCEDSTSLYGDISAELCDQLLQVELVKDGTGLGFSIEGGKDSPLGDRPLVIKRIFKGGVADKEGNLEVGDEIISVNGQSVASMTRTEAWNFLKKLPDGRVLVKARKSAFSES